MGNSCKTLVNMNIYHWTCCTDFANKVCSPQVVGDLKWFLAYKYIFNCEMYICKRKPLVLSLWAPIQRIHMIFTFINSKTNYHYPRLDVDVFTWVFLDCQNPTYVGMLKVSISCTLTSVVMLLWHLLSPWQTNMNANWQQHSRNMYNGNSVCMLVALAYTEVVWVFRFDMVPLRVCVWV